jgi:hypothetical protein
VRDDFCLQSINNKFWREIKFSLVRRSECIPSCITFLLMFLLTFLLSATCIMSSLDLQPI